MLWEQQWNRWPQLMTSFPARIVAVAITSMLLKDISPGKHFSGLMLSPYNVQIPLDLDPVPKGSSSRLLAQLEFLTPQQMQVRLSQTRLSI